MSAFAGLSADLVSLFAAPLRVHIALPLRSYLSSCRGAKSLILICVPFFCYFEISFKCSLNERLR